MLDSRNNQIYLRGLHETSGNANLEDEMKSFREVLNEAIAPTQPEQQKANLLQDAYAILDELNQTQERLNDISFRMNGVIEQINAALASEIRQIQPKLPISLNGGRCCVGYRSSNLSMKPDLSKKQWAFDTSNKCGRHFVRDHSHLTHMGDIQPLAKAIVGFFNGRYRSLGG